MQCKEIERLIQSFVEKKMDFRTLREFSEHMESCEECKEELVIQFLVTEGMQRLEDGDAFDLQKELQERLLETKQKIRFHKKLVKTGMALAIIGTIAIAAMVVWLIL